MEDQLKFSSFIKSVRFKVLLSKDDFAQATGISVAALGLLESGATKQPSFKTLRRVKTFLEQNKLDEFDKNLSKFIGDRIDAKGNWKKNRRTDAGSLK